MMYILAMLLSKMGIWQISLAGPMLKDFDFCLFVLDQFQWINTYNLQINDRLSSVSKKHKFPKLKL